MGIRPSAIASLRRASSARAARSVRSMVPISPFLGCATSPFLPIWRWMVTVPASKSMSLHLKSGDLAQPERLPERYVVYLEHPAPTTEGGGQAVVLLAGEHAVALGARLRLLAARDLRRDREDAARAGVLQDHVDGRQRTALGAVRERSTITPLQPVEPALDVRPFDVPHLRLPERRGLEPDDVAFVHLDRARLEVIRAGAVGPPMLDCLLQRLVRILRLRLGAAAEDLRPALDHQSASALPVDRADRLVRPLAVRLLRPLDFVVPRPV